MFKTNYFLKKISKIIKIQKICNKYNEKNCLNSYSPNYFLTIDLKYQLTMLLKNEFFVSCLLRTVRKQTNNNINNEEVFEDVHDGDVYKTISSNNQN